MTATGSLLGLALGDALGAPTEFLDVPAITDRFGPWRDLDPPAPRALVTDDTQMALAVARALPADRPDALEQRLRAEFVRWLRSPDNNRAPGATCLTACRLLEAGHRWQDASQVASKGCGANMRVTPLGLVPGLTDEQRAGAAQLQAGLTHGHPTGLAASDLTAHAVLLLTGGTAPADLPGRLRAYAEQQRGIYHERWLGDLAARAGAESPQRFIASGWDECLAVLDRLETGLRDGDEERDPCTVTGQGWVAEEALGTALLCFLLFPDRPVLAVRRAAATAGDSDSIAALTGAFAGAHCGAEAWPADWVARLEHRDELRAIGAVWDAAR